MYDIRDTEKYEKNKMPHDEEQKDSGAIKQLKALLAEQDEHEKKRDKGKQGPF